MRDTTRPVGANLTWEQYCSRVGVDPHAARAASLTSALALALRRLDAALLPPRVPSFDTEPGEPTPDK
jgi:hypothetical protein